VKVLHYIASKVWGGAEKSFTELCNQLSEEMEIIAVLPKENKIEERLNKKIKVYHVSNGSRYTPLLYWQLAKIIRREQPDIVHTHSAKASEIIYLLNKWMPFIQIATKRNTRKGKVFNKIYYVTAISKATRDSIANDHVALIYNGIMKHQVEKKPKENREFSLLAIGGLDRIKGFDILIEEVAKLDIPFKLKIVGDGVEQVHLQQLIDSLDLSEKVILTGYREDIPSLISASDVVIVSSHSEGFSRVVVETLFYGTMMVSTKVGLSPEVLPEALLVEQETIAEKLADVYRRQDFYRQMFDEVKQKYAGQFELKNNIAHYIEYYKEVLNEVKREKA